MTPPPFLFCLWLAACEYPAMWNSASFIWSLRWVSAKATKYGFSTAHSSRRKGNFSRRASFELSPCIFAIWNFGVWLMGVCTSDSCSPLVWLIGSYVSGCLVIPVEVDCKTAVGSMAASGCARGKFVLVDDEFVSDWKPGSWDLDIVWVSCGYVDSLKNCYLL